MNKIKSIAGYCCGILFSVSTFVWYVLKATSAKVYVANVLQGAKSNTLYDLFSEKSTHAISTASVVFSIITLVVAGLLAIGCILGLLETLNVVHIKHLNIVNYVLSSLFVVTAVVAIVLMACHLSSNVNNVVDLGPYKMETIAKVGAAYIMTIVSSIMATAGVVVATIKCGKKK